MNECKTRWIYGCFLGFLLACGVVFASGTAYAMEPVGCDNDRACQITFSQWNQSCESNDQCHSNQACIDVDGSGYCAALPTDATACSERHYQGMPMSDVAFALFNTPEVEFITVCANTTAQCKEAFCAIHCQSNADCGGDFPVCDTTNNMCSCDGDCQPELIGCQSDADCGGEYPKCNLSTGACVCTWNSCEEAGFGCNDDGFCECTGDECIFDPIVGDLDYPAPDVCKNLEAAWNPARQVTWVGIIPLWISKMFPVKEVYLQIMCGLQPHRILPLVARGEGKILSVNDPNNPHEDLASVLDDLFPNFPKVQHIYIRGGGMDRPVVVIPLAEGYLGPFLEPDRQGVEWEEETLKRVELIWNALPYEYLRRAAEWLHDVAQVEDYFAIKGTAALTWFIEDVIGASADWIPTFDRAMAFPFGSWMQQKNVNNRRGPDIWIHELAHYNHYQWSGIRPFMLTDDFSKISQRNAHIGWCPFCIKIPFWFKHLYEESNVEPEDGEQPFGYVTPYAHTGEWRALEDFADTLSIAVGVTNRIRDYIDNQDPGYCNQKNEDGIYYSNTLYYKFCFYECEMPRCYQFDYLYNRQGDDAAILEEKFKFFEERYNYFLDGPTDADGNDVIWRYSTSDSQGMDCDDANPVVTECPEVGDSCPDIPVCAAGATCFNHLCVEDTPLRISLAWMPAVDLDLHVRTPGGTVISSRNTVEYDPENSERMIGRLTFDACAQIDESGCVGSTSPHVENIVWNDPLSGAYDIWVVNYSGRRNTAHWLLQFQPIVFQLEISRDGTTETFLHSIPAHANTVAGLFHTTY